MRRWLILSLATFLAMGVATALADVTVTADIDKTESKKITETIRIIKFVDLQPIADVTANKAAESDALVNQLRTGDTESSTGSKRQDTLTGSARTNSGILSVNQAAGNLNNQASAVSVAVDVEISRLPGSAPTPSTGGFAEAQAAADQRNSGNTITTVDLLTRDATIRDSIADNTGVVHANQSAGTMNSQANTLSVGVSLTGGAALSEADLGQFTVSNSVSESGTLFIKSALLTNSVTANKGVVGVNQSSGNLANQANVVSIAASLTR